MKKGVPIIETFPPKPPRDYYTTVSARKEFPLAKGDLLIVRNGSGRVVERYSVGDHLFTLEKDGEKRATYHADLTTFDRG